MSRDQLSAFKAPVSFVTLGMFIIDEFSFSDEEGKPTGKTLAPQERLPANEIGMIVDRGQDFPTSIDDKLLEYGSEMWLFRSQSEHPTTRALNSYTGEHRNFAYITPRTRLTPQDLTGTRIATPRVLHFICSPKRASVIISEVQAIEDWHPTTIYEPIPDSCVPAELPCLIKVLRTITILSPNAEEALSLLSMPLPPTRASIEDAASRFVQHGIGESGTGWVIIRSGSWGAYVKAEGREGKWIDAFWTSNTEDNARIVDVTGAGNSFLGGLAAGFILTGDVMKATFYASVSASFTIEQAGLPTLSLGREGGFLWNGDIPVTRLEALLTRYEAN